MTDHLFGHAEARAELDQAIASGRSHHAWLIHGSEGIGKASLAWQAARFTLADRDLRGDAGTLQTADAGGAISQIKALAHPGLLLIRVPYDLRDKRLRTVITVDEVRKLRGFLSLTGAGGGWRVVIVDRADDLNIAAANALLKSLEEPPPKTLFFLVTERPGRLLPTIRSRCRMLALHPLGSGDVLAAAKAALAGADAGATLPQPDALERYSAAADGSPGRLLTLASAAGAGLAEFVDGLFAKLPALDWPEVHRLADDLASPAQSARADLFFELLLARLAGDVRGRAAAAASADADHRRALATRAELWETLVREKASAEALNLDRKTLVLDAVARLQAASRA
ncbi:MAG: DNA polymerase III subunit delta' [Pseudomonadota bacterium]